MHIILLLREPYSFFIITHLAHGKILRPSWIYRKKVRIYGYGCIRAPTHKSGICPAISQSIDSYIYGVDVAVGVSVGVEVGVDVEVAVIVDVLVAVGVGEGVPWRRMRGASHKA